MKLSDFDKWLTLDPRDTGPGEIDEYDPFCQQCGHQASNHPRVQIGTDQGDYETQVCP